MLKEDIIEGPLETEEPGSYLSNLVITEKKWDPNRIRITLDCQQVNKDIFKTHEPIPTTEELRHSLKGSNRFSVIDITNCYHQFEIEPNARKLFTFRTPWGIFRYKRMVQGTSPASSEIQKKIRETIKKCHNAINIKDDILIFGKDDEHDQHLVMVLQTLYDKGLTLRKEKCSLGKSEVKWFGNIYTKDGMSPDPEKCKIIKEWAEPTSCAEIKSFLQTVQFNAKFLFGRNGEKSYPELTKPLRDLTKKNSKFTWGQVQSQAFQQLKQRLCSNRVLVPYDTALPTRLYVDSSPIGTQATVAQKHPSTDGDHVWRPVNHTSRSWTQAEAGYGQIERESNGILTGMFMNKMYTIGADIVVVTDHKPLVMIYNDPKKPKQLRVDRHRTKLLPFRYTVVYEPGDTTPCDYGSRHPPVTEFTDINIQDWAVESGNEILINRVIEDLLPQAVTLVMLQSEIAKDPTMIQLKEDIVTNKYCRNSLSQFKKVFAELSFIDSIIVRGEQVIIPKSMEADIIGIAHEGHAGTDKTLNLLRQTCWFPAMAQKVKLFVQSCLPCNAAIPNVTPQPLQPNLLPDRPWQCLHADFKGPIGSKYYLHVIIDQYSKYPEVDIVKSTSFAALEPCLDRIIASHGIPERISTDNGSPYFGHEMAEYTKRNGIKHDPVTPEDPQSNGFAESFVKLLCKFLHTKIIEGQDPKKELQNYLLLYRATPHSSTGKSPAEMLNGRKIKTKLPQVFSSAESQEKQKIRQYHNEKKLQQKTYFDRRRNAKNTPVNHGDKVLIRQKKTTINSPFDPKPYKVIKVVGNRVTAERGESKRTRDKNYIKVLKPRPVELIPSWENGNNAQRTNYNDLDIEGINIYKEILPQDIEEVEEQPNSLFAIDEEEENRMNEMFQNIYSINNTHDIPSQCSTVTESPSKRVLRALRSHNKNLTWNKNMNSENVIIEQSNDNADK